MDHHWLAWAGSVWTARRLNHDYIGTEHILLGLIREGDGVAAQVLVKLGADLNRVRQQVIELISGQQPIASCRGKARRWPPYRFGWTRSRTGWQPLSSRWVPGRTPATWTDRSTGSDAAPDNPGERAVPGVGGTRLIRCD
jgi:hypothetical protein